MITVAKLIEELKKFPVNAVCFAYEGEVTGLIIKYPGERMRSQGIIYCSEGDDGRKNYNKTTNAGLD